MNGVIAGINLTYYAIPAAWVISIVPHFYAIRLFTKSSGKEFDNANPKDLLPSTKSNPLIPDQTKQKIARCESAAANGFENLPLFAAAVVASNVAKVPTRTTHLIVAGYLASRVIYNILYIRTDDPKKGAVRSVFYTVGAGFLFSLFIMAGRRTPYFVKL
eukprot:TRINITY_DN838_c0_g1_i1.p1 TRINITY_DN838_c0_g1~~TRINITY_DN838_c0_g1_i1.p1  ORF type:complete len:167 (-),score=33.21 TRINITY_DN838_c0_g1_i1:57-536(-)